jgi:hypothetical protein
VVAVKHRTATRHCCTTAHRQRVVVNTRTTATDTRPTVTVTIVNEMA